MDGEEMLDWELVHGSDTDSFMLEEKESSVIDDGVIVSDHFSADHRTAEQSIGSGDSSRVDYPDPNPVDLGFDRLNVYQSGGVRNELGFIDGEVKVSDFHELGFIEDASKSLSETDDLQVESQAGGEEHVEDSIKCLSETDHLQLESQVGLEEHVEDASKCLSETDNLQSGVEGHVEDASKCLSETDDLQVESQASVEEHIEDAFAEGNQLVSGDSGMVSGGEEVASDSEAVEGSGGDVVAVDSAVRSGNESQSRETVWWKMPFVIVKYYAFRIGPVWSVSMAAAVMGFVLLGRRLYHMKKKAQRFQLKVAIDEKKASRVMSQAARLNEAFSEVSRVPVIRPTLPSPGAWPLLSLR